MWEGVIMNTDKENERPLILIVDDSKIIIMEYTNFFQEDHGFEVLSAINREEAIHRVETLTRPAVLILDRMLYDAAGNPVFGENLLIEMMQRTRFPIITILHSGDTTLSAQLNAIKAGAYWYLPKGCEHELFMAHVWQALAVAKLLIEPNEDPLTKALNRRAMFDRVTRELSRAKRVGSTTACLMYDVDKLKVVNDTYGHTTGDEVIVSVVRSVREHLRPTDLVCRYGGDEILIFLFDVEEGWLQSFTQSSCLSISEKKIVIQGGQDGNEFLSVRASVGWTILSSQEIEKAMEKGLQEGADGETFEQKQGIVLRGLVEKLIEEADSAMYVQKVAHSRVMERI